MKAYKQIGAVVSYLSLFSMLCVVATVPFYYGWCQRISLYLFALCYPLDYVVNRRWKGWHWSEDKWVYILMIAFFLLTPLWQLFDTTPPTPFYYHQLSLRVAFLVIGAMGLLGMTDKLRPTDVGYTMLLTSVCIIGYVLYKVQPLHCSSWHGFEAAFNWWRMCKVHSHMVVDVYMNIALVFGYHILRQPLRRWIKVVTGVLMVVVLFGLSISDGRTGLVTAACVALVLGVYVVSQWNKRLTIPVLLLTVFIGGWIVMQNQRINEDALRREPRWVVWRYSVEMAMDSPISGYGLSTLSRKFVEESVVDEEMNARYIHGVLDSQCFKDVPRTMTFIHPHNVFLALWLEYGFIGPLLYLMLLIVSGLCAVRGRRIYMWMSAFVIFSQSMFEPLGDHLLPIQIGIVLLVWLANSQSQVYRSKPSAHSSMSIIPPSSEAHS